jgi:hypothetical protein
MSFIIKEFIEKNTDFHEFCNKIYYSNYHKNSTLIELRRPLFFLFNKKLKLKEVYEYTIKLMLNYYIGFVNKKLLKDVNYLKIIQIRVGEKVSTYSIFF